MNKLFQSAQLGELKLKNHIVMAPLTRSRAIGNIPNELMAEYYEQRSGAGLIITEGTSPSPNGLGYSRIPGLFTQEQVNGWKKVTSAVHAKGAKIFVQIMHTGRVSHSLNLPQGAQVLAPSAVAVSGTIWTDQSQLQSYPVPKEMSLAEIEAAKKEYVKAAKLAIEAGFDGVELHAANGYLLEQFLNPNANRRTDDYGGTPEKRMRFVLETAKAVVDAIGNKRVGIRVSPYGAANDTGPFEGVDEFYGKLASSLSELGLIYMHVVDHSAMGAPRVSPEVKNLIRKNFAGSVILSGAYDAKRANHDLQEKHADLIAFGRPFISNPNLVQKLEQGLPLNELDPNTLYTPGPKGYTDYPA